MSALTEAPESTEIPGATGKPGKMSKSNVSPEVAKVLDERTAESLARLNDISLYQHFAPGTSVTVRNISYTVVEAREDRSLLLLADAAGAQRWIQRP